MLHTDVRTCILIDVVLSRGWVNPILGPLHTGGKGQCSQWQTKGKFLCHYIMPWGAKKVKHVNHQSNDIRFWDGLYHKNHCLILQGHIVLKLSCSGTDIYEGEGFA